MCRDIDIYLSASLNKDKSDCSSKLADQGAKRVIRLFHDLSVLNACYNFLLEPRFKVLKGLNLRFKIRLDLHKRFITIIIKHEFTVYLLFNLAYIVKDWEIVF